MEMNEIKRRGRFRRYDADYFEQKRYCELQGDQNIANQAGAAFRADLNGELQALVTQSSGASAPATTYAYQPWADTTSGLMKQRNAANTGWLVRSTLKETFVVAKSSGYTVLAADYLQTFKCSTTFSLLLTAAATLGDGFIFQVINTGTGVITIDPNSTEQIDGATTITLAAGDGCTVFCDGSAFFTIGRRPSTVTPLKNWLIDGQMQGSKVGVAATLSTSPQYGKALMWSGWASSGAISAGSLTIDTAATIGSVGRALYFSGITLTGTGQISARIRLHSSRAIQLKNQTVSFLATVLQDTGGPINFTVVVRKPTAQDNYAGVTVIGTSSATSVPTATSTPVPYNAVALGDCSFGLEIEIQAAVGIVTTKNVRMTDFVLNIAASVGSYLQESRDEADRAVGGYVNSTFPDGVSPAQAAGYAGAFQTTFAANPCVGHEYPWAYPMLLTTPALTTYNPINSNANWYDTNNTVDRTWVTPSDINNRHVAPGITTISSGCRMSIHFFADGRL